VKKILTLVLLLVAPEVGATDVAGYDLLIPVVGRANGAHGSVWRTDLYVTNAERRNLPAQTVTIIAGDDIRQLDLPPRATIVIRDLTHSAGLGPVRIGTTDPGAKITARARIFNVGSPQGEYGQIVPAIPVAKLSRETYLPGLTALHGNRTNVGIANPSNIPADVSLDMYDEYGDYSGGFTITVPPRGLHLLNDVFAHFQTGPLENATLQVTSTKGVYAYASIVRSDSGDGDFIVGTGVRIDDTSAVIEPACENPARLSVTPFPSDGWIVTFYPGTPATSTAQALAAKYGFTPRTIYEDALQGFTADLNQTTIAALRCEPSVRAIDQNAYIPLP
jgi:hypothetical protein